MDKNYPIEEIPRDLQHKPIIACCNNDPSDSEDVKYLSVGQSQYDSGCLSLKVFRRAAGETRWSRGEDIPAGRLLSMSVLLLGGLINFLRDDADGFSTIQQEQWIDDSEESRKVFAKWLETDGVNVYKKLDELEKCIKVINRIRY